jgi:antitoxin YefM
MFAVHLEEKMDTVSVNRFRDNLKGFIEDVVGSHEPLKVTRRGAEAFIVVSEQDWEREQESLYILQNTDLMQQIAKSLVTHAQGTGHKPTAEQMNAILGV